MNLQGKGFFIEDLMSCEGGDSAAILSAARTAGIIRLLIKLSDGSGPVTDDLNEDSRLVQAVKSLKAGGMEVWAWWKLYGSETGDDIQWIAKCIPTLDVKGLVIEAVGGYHPSGGGLSPRQFMDGLRKEVKIPLALCSYRFPNFHPEIPWAVFLEGCDLHMPQVFWELSHDAGAQLREARRQCDALPNGRPFVPTAAVYGPVGTWSPTQADLADFFAVVKSLGIQAVNFFEWNSCRSNLPELWETIAALDLPGPSQPQDKKTNSGDAVKNGLAFEAVQPASPSEPDEFALRFVAALNSHQPARIAALYASGATRVSAGQTLHGSSAIQADYADLFKKLPANARFSLLHTGIQGMVHTLSWQADKMNGLTTLVVEAGKITQDYTHLE